MQLGWPYPVVVNTATLRIPRQTLPILYGHSTRPEDVLGQTDEIWVQDGQILATGRIWGSTDSSDRVLDLAAAGFQWRASIGSDSFRTRTLDPNTTETINERPMTGPLYVVEDATLHEISIVPVPADPNTATNIAMPQQPNVPDPDTNAQPEQDDPITPPNPTETQDDPHPANVLASLRHQLAAEAARAAALTQICASDPSILPTAIREGWDPKRAALEVLRSSRPTPAPKHSAPPMNDVLAAALCLSAGIPERHLADYGEQTLNLASSAAYRGYGLSRLIHDVAAAAGTPLPPGPITTAGLTTAFEAHRRLQAAGEYSTISLTSVLADVANKALLAAYRSVASVATTIAAQADVVDFKVANRYRLTAGGQFAPVSPDGELRHAHLTDSTYTNQLETYGAVVSISRKMLINDDLGTFLQLPAALGRNAAQALERATFALLLSNPGSFFSTGNRNLLTGSSSALSIDGLTAAEQLFLDQTDPSGQPILLEPAYLLVPTTLKVAAQVLMTETRIVQDTATPTPAANPHAGKWQPLASPYLNSQALPGSSPTAWYLLANPADVAAIEIVYLRGQRTPTIEAGEPDFVNLGVRWRAFFDFGVALQDPRAAVKSTGT
jgi:hypothetical protein